MKKVNFLWLGVWLVLGPCFFFMGILAGAIMGLHNTFQLMFLDIFGTSYKQESDV